MKKKNDLLKILCLAAGLSLGLVLLAKVCFIEQYNDCIPDRERVYQIKENFHRDKEEALTTIENISGGVAPGMAAEIPEIEARTRATFYNSSDGRIVLPDESFAKAHIWLADSCFFDVLGIRVLTGDAKEILSHQGHAIISLELAERLGGVEKALGMTVAPEEEREMKLVIDGVFETLPENCSLSFDMVASVEYLAEWSRDNWFGNDRYMGFVKCREAVDTEMMKEKMLAVEEKHVDFKALGYHNISLYYTLVAMGQIAKEDASMQNMKWIMLLLGLGILVISVLNYLVIVVSTLVNRMKEIAVYKCYGASFRQILSMVFRESLTHMILALVISAVIVFLIKDTAETLLAASLVSLFSPKTCAVLAAVCLVLLAVTTFVPAWIFSRVPVAAAFRTMRESKRVWKLGLLFVQISLTAVIVCLLVVITLQYSKLYNIEPGYDYERVAVVDGAGIDEETTNRLASEIAKLPEAEKVSTCCFLPIANISGNNVYGDDGKEQLFNVADMYFISEGFFDVMGIKMLEGQDFRKGETPARSMIVNREFVRKMETFCNLEGSAIGKQLLLSEHSETTTDRFTIVGVCEDYRLGTPNALNLRPMVFFFEEDNCYLPPFVILIRLNEMSAANLQKINNLLAEKAPADELSAQPYRSVIEYHLNNERNIRNSLIICSIVALIIAIIGLLGYTADEMNRRRKEIAILKVLGLGNVGILKILTRDITLIAIPALAIGSVISYYIAEQWLKDYSDKIELGALMFVITALIIYLIIEACVILRAYKTASENPAKNLKSE